MIRWNLFFEVEKVEQLALIDPLATHHDRPPSLKASGKRNHDSSIFTRPFSTGSTQSGHERAAFAAMHATGLLLFIDTGCKRPHELAMDSSHHARRIRARARRLSAGAWDMRMH